MIYVDINNIPSALVFVYVDINHILLVTLPRPQPEGDGDDDVAPRTISTTQPTPDPRRIQGENIPLGTSPSL